MRALALGLTMLAANVHAGEVYKCVKGKQVSFQSEPCGPDQEVRRIVAYVPEHEEPAWQRRQRIEREMDARNAALRSGRAQPTGAVMPAYSGRNPDVCESAKRRRAMVLEQAGMTGRLEAQSPAGGRDSSRRDVGTAPGLGSPIFEHNRHYAKSGA